MWRSVIYFIILFLILSAPKNIFAIPLSIDQFPKDISSEFLVTVKMFGAKSATNYFKILLYKEGTHVYVAETWTGSSWYSGSNEKEYPAFSVHSGNETHELRGKIKTGVSSGEYLLSVQRYTASGNAADDSLTPVKVTVTAQETPTPTKTAQPTPNPTVVLTAPPHQENREVIEEEPLVLAASDESTLQKDSLLTPTSAPTAEKSTRESLLFISFILSGVLSLGIGSTLFVRRYKDWYTNRTSL